MASGSDEEDMASNMLLETLIQAWINEKSAPVLLEYEGNAVVSNPSLFESVAISLTYLHILGQSDRALERTGL